jgi:NADH:ubiquinone oxidoreductase subunit E/NAD-dependent dihydropyrimidine dehydrogenase PreA subunit
MSYLPGLGIVKGMSLTLRRFFLRRATIQYPETEPDVAVRFRGRLQLLYDEWGALKCETCFQCAQACPVECIDMGGHDTRGRFWTHWGPAETYAERREESALRRSGLPVPDETGTSFERIDTTATDRILAEHDYDPAAMLPMLEAVQATYGYLPVAALKRISQVSGAPYALIYGLATSYRHLSFERPAERHHSVAVCRCSSCLLAGSGRIAAIVGQTAPVGTLTTHTPGAASPLVTLDGRAQVVTADGAATWARSLARRIRP